MKYHNRTGISGLLLLLFSLLAGVSMAQDASTYGWQIGVGVGYTNYYGDVSNYRINGIKDFYKIYKFADYNKYYVDRPSYSVIFQKKLTPTLGFMIQGNSLQFAMSDRYRKKNGSFDTSSMNYARSLNFRTTLQDAGIAFTFNTNNGKVFKEDAFFFPSFYLGAGVSKFTVKGDLYDENNQPYNYRLPGNIQDGTFETNLRDQRTETDTKYRNIEPYVDLGLALNFRLSDFASLAIQSDIKYSASDYLDDVSRKYRTNYTPAELYAAYPGYNTVNLTTLQRGDDNGVNDFYINNRITLNIALKGKSKPRVFNAPVVYSLGKPSRLLPANQESIARINAARQDSIAKRKADSLLLARRDSISGKNDSITLRRLQQDTLVQNQLQSIRGELTDIKSMLRDQQVRPRYQQLQSQVDSVKNLRNKISTQRVLSREDNFRLRIYDLQVDSIQNEMQKLQWQGQFPGRNNDTLNYYRSLPKNGGNGEVRYNDADVLNERGAGNPTIIDSVSAPDPVWDREVQTLKQDKRYKSDRSYRKSVDSLQRKIDDLKLRSVNQHVTTKLNAQSLPASSQAANERNTLLMRANQRRLDSLQQRLDELQHGSRGVDSARAATGVDTASLNDQGLTTDTVAFNRSIAQMQERLKTTTDSITNLRRQLQRSSDSASYYKRVQFAADDANQPSADTKKKKWYKDIFKSSKAVKKEQDQAAEKNRSFEQQQQYYDDESNRLRRNMDQLEKRNKELSDEYESLTVARNRNRTLRNNTSNPTVIYERDLNDRYQGRNTVDNSEIVALRNEIERLRSQVNTTNRSNYDAARYAPPVSSLTVPVQPALVEPAPVERSDTSHLSSLRSELEQIRNQLDSLRADKKPATATEAKPAAPRFDVSSFPVISVYFNTGAYVLSRDQINKITPFAQAASKNKEASIVLKGFTDPVGNPAVNKTISKKRTEYVRNLLVSYYKLEGSRITMEEPAESGSGKLKKANPLDRRVDIAFQ